ncbi:MAG TPA: hypothetical protein VIS51_10365 [Solirubrobacterales bacterium]
MSPSPLDRRSFLGLTGAAFVCTLAGQRVSTEEGQIDVDRLAGGVEVPPRVAAANGSAASASVAATATASARVREYWVAAEQRPWNIVPTHRDQMMAEPVKATAPSRPTPTAPTRPASRRRSGRPPYRGP